MAATARGGRSILMRHRNSVSLPSAGLTHTLLQGWSSWAVSPGRGQPGSEQLKGEGGGRGGVELHPQRRLIDDQLEAVARCLCRLLQPRRRVQLAVDVDLAKLILCSEDEGRKEFGV